MREGQPCSLTLPRPSLVYDRGGFFSLAVYGADGRIATADSAVSHLWTVPSEHGTYKVLINCPWAGRRNHISAGRGWGAVVRLYMPVSEASAASYAEGVARGCGFEAEAERGVGREAEVGVKPVEIGPERSGEEQVQRAFTELERRRREAGKGRRDVRAGEEKEEVR
jgi:hypothetical protein